MDTRKGLVETTQKIDSTELKEKEQVPKERKKSFEKWIEDVKDDKVSELLDNEPLFKNLCDELLDSFKDFEDREKALDQLLSTVEKLEVRSKHLLECIEIWAPQRVQLLKVLEDNIKFMNPVTKLLTTTRIVGSLIDCASLIGGLLDKQSNYPIVNTAIGLTNSLGFLSFTSSATELLYWKARLEEIMKRIEDDQIHFASVQHWFLQNAELEEATKAVFSFDMTKHIVARFEKIIRNGINDSELLHLLLESALQEDKKIFKNVDLIGRMVAFARSPASRYWCGWVLLRHHKVTLHIARMLLQMSNPQVLASSHSVSTFARSVPRLSSASFWARMGINCLTLYEDINTLRTGGIVEELRQLQSHLEQEMIALQQISRLIKHKSQ